MCYYGFLRSGGVTIPSEAAYDSSVNLNMSTVALEVTRHTSGSPPSLQWQSSITPAAVLRHSSGGPPPFQSPSAGIPVAVTPCVVMPFAVSHLSFSVQ